MSKTSYMYIFSQPPRQGGSDAFSELKNKFFLFFFFIKNFSRRSFFADFSCKWGCADSFDAFRRHLNDLNEWKISTIDHTWASVLATFSRNASNSFYRHLLTSTWLKWLKKGVNGFNRAIFEATRPFSIQLVAYFAQKIVFCPSPNTPRDWRSWETF